MESIRILIIDKCNASCPNCLNKRFRSGTQIMDVAKFETVARYFKEHGVTKIRLMGGEPSIHPDFARVVSISQQLFERVTVFTNGLSEKLLDFKPREKDGINYNSKFAKYLTLDLLMKNELGSRVLSIVIDRYLQIDETKFSIERMNRSINGLKVSLTFDCTANVFKERQELLEKFDALYSYCMAQDIEVVIDHGLPICFLYGTNVPTYEKFSICDMECSGLIDSNCNLRFCNQISDEPFQIFDGERIKPFSLLSNHIQLAYYKRQIAVLKKICVGCPLFNKICNGGCYVQNSTISREDILQNTQLPITKK